MDKNVVQVGARVLVFFEQGSVVSGAWPDYVDAVEIKVDAPRPSTVTVPVHPVS